LYILHSEAHDRYYIGSSQNEENRLTHYNTTEKGFTSRYRPWKLAFVKEFPDKESAQQAERKVKSWKSKLMIEKLVQGEISI
jgi:putative endonuclease